jgi:hypothetical protein
VMPGTSGPTSTSSNEFTLQLMPANTRTTNQRNVLRNFQTLFSPYYRSLSHGLSRNTSGSMPIRNNRTYRRSRASKEETWTHNVFCLADASQLVASNCEKKTVL